MAHPAPIAEATRGPDRDAQMVSPPAVGMVHIAALAADHAVNQARESIAHGEVSSQIGGFGLRFSTTAVTQASSVGGIMKKLWVAVGAAWMLSACSALAQTFDLSADFMSGSGSVTGHVIYDPAAGQVTGGRLETSDAGLGAPSRIYTFPQSALNDSGALLETSSCSDDPYGISLRINNTSGAPKLTNALEFRSGGACTWRSFGRQNLTNIVFTQRPIPAPIPTLSEWAMIMLGVALAGGAALTINRRRTA